MNQERNCLAIHYTSLSSACQAAVTASAPQAAVNDRSGVPTCIRSVICGPNNGQGIAWRTNPERPAGWHRRLYPRDLEVRARKYGLYGLLSLHAARRRRRRGGHRRQFQGQSLGVSAAPVGAPSLTKFGPDRKMLFTLGDDVIGHSTRRTA